MENEFETSDVMENFDEFGTDDFTTGIDDCNFFEQKTAPKKDLLKIIYLTSLICGLIIGIVFAFIGISGAFSKNATEYEGYTYGTQEAKFGADYYTYTYDAQIKTVRAVNQVTTSMYYATKSLAMAVKGIYMLLTLFGIYVSIVCLHFILKMKRSQFCET